MPFKHCIVESKTLGRKHIDIEDERSSNIALPFSCCIVRIMLMAYGWSGTAKVSLCMKPWKGSSKPWGDEGGG